MHARLRLFLSHVPGGCASPRCQPTFTRSISSAQRFLTMITSCLPTIDLDSLQWRHTLDEKGCNIRRSYQIFYGRL
ncbi:hypothetical protein GGI35DRAFT_446964 [Trichoderma velutinum]